MRAIGNNLIIEKIKEGTTKTKGGLLLAEAHKEDVRYLEAKVLNVGDDIMGVKPDDIIFYDRHAGHLIEIGKNSYHVIKLQDIVVVL